MADRCSNSGLLLFFLHIPGHNILKDKYVKLITCYCCYSVEKHLSSNCPKKLSDPTYRVCSKCALHDHDFKSCPNVDDKLKCINCSGEHHAMSNTCPTRKEALRKKRMDGEKQTFSQAVRSSPPASQVLDTDSITKSIALMFLATLKEADNPGSFLSLIHI